jgi:hypothetical protein
LFCEIWTGGAGNEPTESGRMVGGQRMGDGVMIDFYKDGGLLTNGVIVNPNHRDDSTSYPILLKQEAEMQALERPKSKKSGNKNK